MSSYYYLFFMVAVCIVIFVLKKFRFYNPFKKYKKPNLQSVIKKEEIYYSDNTINKKFKFGIVITTFNRPEYLEKTLNSINSYFLDSNVIVIIIDDGSSDLDTINLIKNFESKQKCGLVKILKSDNEGMFNSLKRGWDLCYNKYNCEILCNLDSDVLVKKNWLENLYLLYYIYTHDKDKKSKNKENKNKYKNKIITGFNATQVFKLFGREFSIQFRHRVLNKNIDCYEKESIGGINLFFDRNVYKNIVRKNLNNISWDWKVVDEIKKNDGIILCTKPSVIQHIGISGISNPFKLFYDKAIDF